MFTKILVPLDGSDLAAKILPQVVDLAKTQKAQVTLLYVFDAALRASTSAVMQQALAEENKLCEVFLGQAAKDLEALQALCGGFSRPGDHCLCRG